MNRRLPSAFGLVAAIALALLFSAPALAANRRPAQHTRSQTLCLNGSHRKVRASTCRIKFTTRRSSPDLISHAAAAKPATSSTKTKTVAKKRPVKGGGTSGSGSSSPVSGGLVVGLAAGAAGWGGASTGPRLDSITSQTGAKWLREEFYWSTVEPQPGVFDWSYYDHYMLEMAQRGLHIVAQLDNTPSWAGTDPSTIPTDPTTFAQFVAAFVGRYGANGTFWTQNPTLSGSAVQVYELYNEPYFNSGNDYNPAAYANLIKAASTAGKAVDPTAKFLIEADMQSAQNAATNWIWWVDALYAAVPNLNNYFDGIAMHDYGDDTTNLNPIIPNQPYPNFGHILRILDLRQQFTNHGAANKPFWIMEAGWSTCTGGDTDCVTDAQQAANLSTMFGYINTSWSSFVQAIFIYSFQDGSNPTQIGDAYGLTTLAGTAKPALAVFQHEETLAGS